MPSYVTPKKNTAYVMYIGLPSQANPLIFQANPTIAAGDFQVSIDGGALANPATLPTVTPAGGKMVKVSLSAAEMNGDIITLVASDAAGGEWADVMIDIATTTRQIDDLAYPAVSGRSIDVASTGEVGLDFDNIKQATGATTLTNITVPMVTTLTGHTPQTGDSYARLGVPAGASVSADIANAPTLTAAGILTTALTESYATDGATFTLSQALYMIWATVNEYSVAGATITAKKLDGATTAMTWTLDDGTNPTARTRTT